VSGDVRESWVDRRVIGYAHQGGAWEAPSSTLFAITHALEAGATGVELDVHCTADGHLVVCHDATVDRTTNGSGEISHLTLAELRDLDNAYCWAPGADVSPGLAPDSYPYRSKAPHDHDFRIATLAEAIAVIDGFPGVVVNLDIKRTAPQVEPYEKRLATELENLGRTTDVIVASFNDKATEAFRSFAPEIATSAGTLASAEFWRAAHQGEELRAVPYVALQVPLRHGDLEVVDDLFIKAAHDRGIAVHVWTINGLAEMEHALDMGVDGIISDLPTRLCELLDTRRLAWDPTGRPGGPPALRLSRGPCSAACRDLPSSSTVACASPFSSTLPDRLSGIREAPSSVT
jgi:glycerophosphoryl diester phosphodiesterase